MRCCSSSSANKPSGTYPDLLCRTEGIIPAIESAHAVAGALKLGQEMGTGSLILVNLSGRGDKDVETAAKWFGLLEDGTK